MLWKVYSTVMQMLTDRGVEIESQSSSHHLTDDQPTHTPDHLIDSLKSFETRFGPSETANRNAMAFVTIHPRIGVFFADQETILVDHIRGYQQNMVEKHIKHGILVTKNALSSQCRKVLNDSRLYFETFKESDLVLNITRHVLVNTDS